MHVRQRVCLSTGMYGEFYSSFLFLRYYLYFTKTVNWHKFQNIQTSWIVFCKGTMAGSERIPLAPNII